MKISLSARAIILGPNDNVFLVRRLKAGVEPYWVAPGGGVEDTDASIEDALHREIFEELGATVQIERLLFQTQYTKFDGETKTSFFLCRLLSIDSELKIGPEYQDASRGQYLVEQMEQNALALSDLNIVPKELKEFLVQNVGRPS